MYLKSKLIIFIISINIYFNICFLFFNIYMHIYILIFDYYSNVVYYKS